MPTPAPVPSATSGRKDLQPILVVVSVLAAWFVLNRWVLPRLGVAT